MTTTLRALGRTGITPAQVVKQVLNSNSLNHSEYLAFWSSLQALQSGPTKMLIELLNKYVELEKQAKKYEKTGRDMDRVFCCILNTIRFLDLFFAVEPNENPNLRKALRAYEVLRAELPAQTSLQREADQVIRSVFRSNLDHIDTTNTLVIECAFVNSVENALIQNTGQRDPTFVVLRDNPFIHLRLVARLLAGGDSAKSTLVEIVKQLQSMPTVIRAQPALTNSTLGNVIALLHMLREALCVFPVVDRPFLRRALAAVKVLEAWPMPYGKHASLLCNMIREEMALPGTHVRRRIFSENPLLTAYGNEQAEKYGMQGTDWARGHRSVSVCFNPFLPRAQTIRVLVAKPLAKGQAFSAEMSRAREEVMASVLETCLTRGRDQVAWHFAVVSALHNKHPADIVEWFELMCSAIEHDKVEWERMLRAVKAISPLLSEGGLRLRQEAEQDLDADFDDEDDAFVVAQPAEARASDLKPPPPAVANTPKNKASQLFALKPVSSSKDVLVKQLEQNPAWTHTVPRVPQICFDFLEVAPLVESSTSGRRGRLVSASVEPRDTFLDRKQSGYELASKKKSGNKEKKKSVGIPGLDVSNPLFAPAEREDQHRCPQRYLRYPNDYEELLRDARAVLPPDQTEGDALERAKAATEASLAGRRPVLRRVIFGGHDVLHRALATYVALRAMEPDLCALFDFKFFLVPLGRNDLAAFLAQRDGWYRKHVYVAFHAPLLMVPQIKTSGFEGDDLTRESPTTVPLAGAGGHPSDPRSTPHLHHRSSVDDFIGGGIEDFGGGEALTEQDLLVVEPNEDLVPSNGAERGHRLDATPAKLLRYLLADYVRGAEFVFNTFVYDCECWETPDTIETDRGPDLTIPFCERVELGLWAAFVDHANKDDFQGSFIGEATSEGLGLDFSFDEMLTDKTFLKAVSGANPDVKITTPELSIAMFPMDVDGVLRDQPRDAIELADSSYFSLNIASVPRYSLPLSSSGNKVAIEPFEPLATAANPGFPWLEVQTVSAKSSLLEQVRKKDKKPKDLEQIKDALKAEARTHHVGLIDIRTSVSSRLPFLIAVDSQLFGPFYRVRIRLSTALSTSGGQALNSKTPIFHLPISTFVPVWMGV